MWPSWQKQPLHRITSKNSLLCHIHAEFADHDDVFPFLLPLNCSWVIWHQAQCTRNADHEKQAVLVHWMISISHICIMWGQPHAYSLYTYKNLWGRQPWQLWLSKEQNLWKACSTPFWPVLKNYNLQWMGGLCWDSRIYSLVLYVCLRACVLFYWSFLTGIPMCKAVIIIFLSAG